MPLFTTTAPTRDSSLAAAAVPVRLDRHMLEKRRWRMTADDGTDIAVALDSPAGHGDCLVDGEGRAFVIQQVSERVLRIPLPQNASAAARLGWLIGNQHLQAAFEGGYLLIAHEPHTEQLLSRLGLEAESATCLFRPDPHSAGAHHHAH